LANPPFNDSDWGQDRLAGDVRWKYGTPPAGNANFAWVQHFIHHLAPHGLAGFVLANGSMSSSQSGEGEIRKALIEADLLDGQQELLGKVESSGHGTGKLPSEILLAYPISMPSAKVQTELATMFDLFANRIATAKEESRTLAALRDLLLPKLLSGELRIRDAEREVARAL
jgi:hypothetical protein